MSIIACSISKNEKIYAYVLIFFYFELYVNSCKEIYSFICYYKKEEEVYSKKFYSIYFVAVHKLLLKKCINNIKSKLLFLFEQEKCIEEVYIVSKRFKSSFARHPSYQE